MISSRLRSATLAASLLALSFPTSALSGPANLVEIETAIFAGSITKDTVKQFIQEYDTKVLKKVIIFSPGGDGEAGLEFGEWIQRRQLDIQVRNICMSACANYVFVAGRNKIIEPGALVIWHGGMEQQDIRELQQKYESLHAPTGTINPEDKEFVRSYQFRYEVTFWLRKRQAKFYSDLGIDEYITRIGQEPIHYKIDGWGASTAFMEKFGIHNVQTPENYGKANYLKANGLAIFLCKGVPIFFDLNGEDIIDSDGNKIQS